MKTKMKKILEKYSDCNKFSLTGGTLTYISQEKCEKYNISEQDFINAIENVTKKEKEEQRKHYEEIKENLTNYPDFDKLYDEIKQECYDFDCEENKQFYINKSYNIYKEIGMTDEKVNRILDDFFRCSFIADEVGKKTKYGKEYKGFFWNLYHTIGLSIDRQKDKEKYCIKNGKNPIEQIPEELKNHLLYYEVSFSNEVTTSSGLMINYYFKLNDETKKYLLKFDNDFCLEPLEDLAIYKDNELKFYSCTHERFNSL